MSKQDEQAKLAQVKKTLEKEFDQVCTFGVDEDQHLQQLASIAVNLGFESHIGKVVYAGQTSSGNYQVQFNTGNTGYASAWPEWAFEQAKSALLYGKQLWVIADGKPFGYNLLQVLIRSQSV